VRKYCYVASARRRSESLGRPRGSRGAGNIVSPRAQLVSFIVRRYSAVLAVVRRLSVRLSVTLVFASKPLQISSDFFLDLVADIGRYDDRKLRLFEPKRPYNISQVTY